MHYLVVGYGHPEDTAAFDTYYEGTHVPLANLMPGVQEYTWRHCTGLGDEQPPYYLLAQLSFESEQALRAGLASTEGETAVGDVPNFATGGVTIWLAHD